MSADPTLQPKEPTKPPHLLLLLAGSFLLYNGSYVVDQAFRWTNTWEGIENGLFHVLLLSMVWLIMGLIPGLLAYAIWRWRGWRRFRSAAIMAPGLLSVFMTATSLILSPPTASNRLKHTAGIELPASAQDVRTHFSGGGITDYSDTYSFRCSPEDTEKLIKNLGLTLDKRTGNHNSAVIPQGSQNPWQWSGKRLYYSSSDPDEIWSYDLITNEAKDRVILVVSCI